MGAGVEEVDGAGVHDTAGPPVPRGTQLGTPQVPTRGYVLSRHYSNNILII